MGASQTAIRNLYATKMSVANLVYGFNGSAMSGATAVALTAGTYQEIGRLMIKAGQRVLLGAGAYSALNTAVGRIYADIQTSASALIPGSLRIDLHDPTDHYVATLFEIRTDAQGLTSTTLADQPVLNLLYPGGGFNESFVFKVAPDANATEDGATTVLSVSFTVATLTAAM